MWVCTMDGNNKVLDTNVHKRILYFKENDAHPYNDYDTVFLVLNTVTQHRTSDNQQSQHIISRSKAKTIKMNMST